jgi:hypothetical protein
MPAGGTIAAHRNRNESSARSFQGRLMLSLHLWSCVHNGAPDLPGDDADGRAAARYFQSSLLASFAPSASACSFAQAICG